MPEEAASDQASLLGGVQDIVSGLLPTSLAIADDLASCAIERTPELHGLGLEGLVTANCRAHIAAFLDYLARGVPVDKLTLSQEIVENARTMVRGGLPLDSVLRGHRVAASRFIALWTDAVAERHRGDSAAAIGIIKHGSAYTLEWVDVICELMTTLYSHEMERLSQVRSHARLEEIRGILNGEDLRATIGRRVRSRMSGGHLAVILRDCAAGGAALDPALRQLCDELGVVERLGVHADERTMWCWLGWPLSRPVSLPRPAAPFMIAVGRPAEGMEGFRRSHRQALDALRIAELAGRQPGTVTYYDEVDVAAVCTADMERTRAFIQAELGALVIDDEAARRTRETLAVFYAANSNYRAAAVQLGVHHNTVRYRLQQAERALGRPVNERRLALELALHLTDLIGATNSEGTSA